MRILIITNHFYPETFRVNDVAFDLSSYGHDVTVLTAIPDYPKGHFFNGYGLFKKRRERINGVRVLRAAIIPRGNGRLIRMVMNYVSSLFSTCIWSFCLSFGKRYDAIFIHDTSPATICIPALLIKSLRGTPIVHWILDIWPESLVAGGVNNKALFSIIDKFMRFVYKKCDFIQISSEGFKELLLKRGVAEEKIEYLPNWNDKVRTHSKNAEVCDIPKGFIVMFAGNMGEAQNLENVMKAALLTKEHHDIHWLFLGDGRKKPWVERFITDNKMEETVHLLGRHPIEEMCNFFSKADIMLVSLCDEVVFNLTLPAKVQAYMANAKPILAIANGETQHIIQKAGCGWCVSANDSGSLAEKVIHLSSIPVKELSEYGANGLKFYNENFNKDICINRIFKALKQVTLSK